MKPLAALAILLFAACAKEDRSISYDLTCYQCSARYLDADGNSRYVKLAPDTIYTETDTTITEGPFTWSTSFEINPDAPIHFGVSRLSVQGIPTVAKRTIDGMEEARTLTIGGEYTEFH